MKDHPSEAAAHIGLLVKDGKSLFAFWELPAAEREALHDRHGDRAASLARVTLRLESGGTRREVIPPAGSSSHYLATDSPGETAQVELGWTLPSGRFVPIAKSPSVSVPRVSPSPVVSRATLRFPAQRDQARKLHRVQVRKGRPRRARVDAPAGGSDAFRRVREDSAESLSPGGASDAFSPPGSPRR